MQTNGASSSGTIFAFLGLLCFCCLCSLPQRLYGQATTGVVGTVTDQSGAVIPGSKVTVTNVGTGISATVVTGPSGEYAIPNLAVGTYNIAVDHAGFAKAENRNVKLDVATTPRVNFVLVVGKEVQVVNVGGAAPVLQTSGAQVGAIIRNTSIVNLPLNGRSFTQLTLLVPGTAQAMSDTVAGRYALRPSGLSFAANGTRSTNNDYYLDGVSIKEIQHDSPILSPSIDALQEFRVQTSNYDSELGGEGGAYVNMVTKSGTNQFHGAAYEFLRNDKLDGRNFFSPTRPPFRRNDFGGDVGGPVIKNKSFFFGSYEGIRVRKGITQTGIVPNLAERSGDFSSILAQGTQIIDPLTGQPFAGNIIPTGRLSPVATQVLQKYVPLPNVPGSSLNWVSNGSEAINSDQGIGRWDYKLADSDSLFARYAIEKIEAVPPPFFPTDGATRASRAMDSVLGWTHTFGGTMVNDVRFSFDEHRHTEAVARAFKENVVSELGLNGLCEQPACWGIPTFNVSGLSSFGEHGIGIQTVSGPRAWINQFFNLDERFLWTRGTHTLKFGAQYLRHRDTFPEAIYPRGIFGFDGRFTSASGSPNANTALADYLLGLPRTSLASTDIFDPNMRTNEVHPWFEDDWRMTRNLTLNFGIRYDFFSVPVSTSNTISTVDLSAPGGLLIPATEHATYGYPRGLYHTDANNVAPRVGLAWNPDFLNKRAVFRAGYGIFYQREAANTEIDLSINPPFVNQTNVILEPAQVSTFDIRNVFLGASPIPLLTFGIYPNFGQAYIQSWNAAVQYELAPRVSLQIGYVANHGTHLSNAYDVNQALLGPGTVQSRRPYYNFGSVNWIDNSGASNYNSLQVEVRSQDWHGLTFLSSWTYAKGLDDSTGTFIGEGGQGIQNVHNRNAEKGLSPNTPAQRLVLSYIYQLPVGHGHPYGSHFGTVAQGALGGWQIQGITTFQSGFPLGVYVSGDIANVGTGAQRPNLIGNPNNGPKTLREFFNTAAFAAPASGTFGSAGRNIVIGPGINEWDFSVFKSFQLPINEASKLEFRAEAFNIFNHANFTGVGSTFGTSTFGVITGAAEPRDVQLGLKLIF